MEQEFKAPESQTQSTPTIVTIFWRDN